MYVLDHQINTMFAILDRSERYRVLLKPDLTQCLTPVYDSVMAMF